MEASQPPITPAAVTAENGSRDSERQAIIDRLSSTRKELQPFGKSKVFEVPGYEGGLGVEYQYISSEVTEEIARLVGREVKNVNNRGLTLLSSLETLIKGCKCVVINVNGEWQNIGGKDKPPVKFSSELAKILNFDAENEREVVLSLFGSEHAIIQQNILYSRWLTNVQRLLDEDFLG